MNDCSCFRAPGRLLADPGTVPAVLGAGRENVTRDGESFPRVSQKGADRLMMAEKGTQNMLRILALVALGLGLSVSASAAVVQSSANGITARIHSAEDIEKNVGVLGFALDPADDQWVPFDPDLVAQALDDMTGFQTDVTVDVYILPAPPSSGGDSFAHEDAIYLAPAFGRVAASTVAYITSHEMGHVLTWACLDRDPARWEAYLDLRGLVGDAFGPDQAHAQRPREILAEDIRFLFGGRLATISGTIENADVTLPDAVFGLESLLSGFLSNPALAPVPATAKAFPNPCNPMTTIAMTLSGAEGADSSDAVLRVFDIRGSLVSTVTGAQVDGNRVTMKWTGTDDSGQALASGRYLYVMQAAGVQARGSVTLVR